MDEPRDASPVLESATPRPQTDLERRNWLVAIAVCGLALVIAMSVAAALVLGGDDDTDRDASEDFANQPTEKLEPADECFRVVMEWLNDVPDALAEGYMGGVDPAPLMTQYGSQGRVFNAFVQGQAELIGKVMTEGDPARQLGEVAATVQSMCNNEDGRFDDAPEDGLTGLS